MNNKKIDSAMFGFNIKNPSQFKPYRPLPLKILDWFVSVLDMLVGRVLTLDENKFIDKACKKTGLKNFGDNSFREPLKLLCKFSKEGSPLSFFGRITLRESCLFHLMNKLKIHNEFSVHPEILNEKISKPIFILGLPRTGTTLLQRLLAQDTENRILLLWEANSLVPPPERETYESDPRIEEYEKVCKKIDYVMPALKAVHQIGSQLPEECINLMSNNLLSSYFSLYSNEYDDWYRKHDLTFSYESHKRQLQLLQWKCPGERWALKYPGHIIGLNSLLKIYPDARIIQTHRDPVDIVPSFASLVTTFRAAIFNEVDPKTIGPWASERLSEILAHGMKVRAEEESGESEAIFQDMYYTEFIKNPIDMVKKIYDRFEIKLSDEAIQRMHHFLDENQQHRLGKHNYSMEQFGLSTSIIQKQFQWYYDDPAIKL